MKEPQQYSIVNFNFDDLPSHYHEMYPFTKDTAYIYFGEIPNMPGHCIVMNMRTGEMHSGYHIEDFRELSQDET